MLTHHALQAKEGVIEEDTGLWESLSTNDQNRRRGAAAERKLKLVSPNFFVSPTRLHFMNVPTSWDEKGLKEACRSAIVARASKARPKMKQVRPRPPRSGSRVQGLELGGYRLQC